MMQMSKEYGTAIFMLAMEAGLQSEYEKALDEVSAVFRQNPEYLDFLASPAISQKERELALERAFGEKVPEYIVSFLKLLCKRGRIRSFFSCVTEYKKLFDEQKKVTAAKVTSTVPLTEAEKSKLKQKLEKMSGRSVVLECFTDNSILGGVIVEMDGKILDGSLRRRLHEVKEVISK